MYRARFVVSHKVEAAEGHERTKSKEDHDLDAVPLDRSVHGTQYTVALGAALRLLVQHVPGTFGSMTKTHEKKKSVGMNAGKLR